MAERVAAHSLASGADHAPPEPGLGPDASAVAHRASCPAPPYVGTAPMYHYGTLSAPPDECAEYEITEVLTHRLCENPQPEPSAELKDESESKHCVDYQFLEQNISHQSILNQSISLLNRQVCGRNGVSVSAVCAVDCVVNQDPIETVQDITVPLGWKRIISSTSVVYISPSGCALATPARLRAYLQTAGTCKCGLRCPLRPEAAFSFDPKVASKPYQVPTGGDLAKLCNHKRKLLATLHGAAEPPKKGGAAEAGPLKQKCKKRLQPGVSMPQMMAQRERAQQGWPQHHEVPAEMGGEARTMSGHVARTTQLGVGGNASPGEHSSVPASHYLTVNPIHSGQRVVGYHQTQSPLIAGNPTINIGQPVLGTNGQIIGVHTGGAKIEGQVRNVAYGQLQERKQTEERPKTAEANPPAPRQSRKQSGSPENAGTLNMFCGGLNQVPPEVVQKIDQQQQIFIQQNQKQIQMAMKGIRMQPAAEQTLKVFDNVPPGQLIIQNGTVMKANPGKTPPWQMKRSDTSPGPSQSPVRRVHLTPEQSPAYQELDDPHKAVVTGGDNFNLLQNFERNVQMMQSRVPPLHMNYMPPLVHQPNEPKKKPKTSPNKKKKIHVTEVRNITFGNNGLKELADSKGNLYGGLDGNPSPSFMDDPSGYLAQQTALLNNTISRQVNSNAGFESPNAQQHTGANSGLSQNMSKSNGPMHQPMQQRNMPQRNHVNSVQIPHFQQQMERPGIQSTGLQNQLPQQHSNMESHRPGAQFMSSDERFKEQNRSNDNSYKSMMSEHVSPPQNMPDSSIVTEKSSDTPRQCCQDSNHQISNQHQVLEQQQRTFMKHHIYNENVAKMETDTKSNISSPNHGFDDSPVTSSTYMDRLNLPGCMPGDSRGPIQGGTVSTSHVSPPEQSPTSSNRSDTPHPTPSPARSNPTTPTPGHYGSPGTPNHSMNLTGSQMMNFISNHNVNKNLMEVGNISLTGANAIVKGPILAIPQRNEQKRPTSGVTIPGYCPPPHLGGGPSHTLSQPHYVQSTVTTMASGHTLMRNTITSVLAGKAHTATTSMSRASNMRPHHPPNVASYAIPPNLPDPFLNSLNLPTSYPLHIAGNVARNMLGRSPMDIVQNMVSNVASSRHETQAVSAPPHGGQRVHSGQILISSTGQIILPHQNGPMPPPAPKGQNNGSSSAQSSCAATNPTQVLTGVGGVQQVISNQPTVLVNTLPAPFVLQPQMMTVDGQVLQQNASQILPQLVTGGLVSQGQSSNDSGDSKPGMVQRIAMLSPDNAKKKGKKRKGHNLTNVLHIAAPQQNTAGVVLQQQHTSPQFSPRGFQLSPNSMSSAPMLQALTIVPGKSGTPAHIVMNGQGVSNNFGSQQIINTSPTQQINLLQPVNLINNASGVVPNFQTFQQFIVPNIGGMVMTTDGTIIQDSSTGVPVQLQLQSVNGQSVLTPIQNQSVLTGGNAGVVIRTQNPHGKIIQSQHSPGAQFLSPNSHIMMNSPTFSGQLSPLIANVSPTSVNFTSPHQMRSANVQQQDMIQCNQMGQVMVPLSPKQTQNRNSSTFVQQNTTIVQHQTTLVSASNSTGGNRLSIDPSMLFNAGAKQKRSVSLESERPEHASGATGFPQETERDKAEMEMSGELNRLLLSSRAMVGHVRHSVSTQTLASQQRRSPPVPVYSSPPDTTTHSPLGPLEHAAGPRVYSARAAPAQPSYADTTTSSPEPADSNSSGMVQCVSSSEPDVPEGREGWLPSPHAPPPSDQPGHLGLMGGHTGVQAGPGRPARPFVESSDAYRTISVSSLNNTHSLTITPNTFSDRALKRKRPEMPYNNDAKAPRHEYGDSNISRQEYGDGRMPRKEYGDSGTPRQEYGNGRMPRQEYGDSRTPRQEYADNEITHQDYGDNKMPCQEYRDSKIPRPNCGDNKIPRKKYGDNKISHQGYGDNKMSLPEYGHENKASLQEYGQGKMSLQEYAQDGNIQEYRQGVKTARQVYDDNAISRQEFRLESKLLRPEFDQDAKDDFGKLAQQHKDENFLEYDTDMFGRRNSRENEHKASPSDVADAGASSSRKRRFSVGDVVWGPAKGYASWPGKLEGVAGGRWTVRWFGGEKSTSALPETALLTLSEGLEANHAARTKCRKSRKLNSLLEKAIQEAMSELDKRESGAGQRRRGRPRLRANR